MPTTISFLLPTNYLLFLIILIEGFASIAIEILAIRQLLPVAGGSVVVTSLIIGIFLLFLALGYARGGQINDNCQQKLWLNFFMSALWVGIGLSYLFIAYFFAVIQAILTPHIIFPLVLYLVLIIAPAIYLLGQTLPITMNIVRQDKTAGLIVGKALGLSTAGSFLGAIVTTLVLMHYLGVAWTVFIVFILLIILTLLLSLSIKKVWPTFFLALGTIFFVYFININIESSQFILTNSHANYQILNHQNASLPENAKILVINDTLSSYTNHKNAFPYIEMMAKIIFDDLKSIHAQILVLGAGGFTLSQNNTGQNHFTYVDIDDQIKKVLIPGFISKMKDQLVIDDARHYLITHDKKYDIIVVDVYSDYKAMPAYLLTREFMQQVKAHLNSMNSYALFNVIANPTFKDVYSRRINNTILKIFGSCTATPVRYFNGISNIVYTCSNSTDVTDQVVYTDNLNTSTTDSFNW